MLFIFEIDSDCISNVLEIGPGYNALSSELFPDASKTLLEPSEKLFVYNKSKFENNQKIEVRAQDIEGYFESSSDTVFDLVVLSGVLHELTNPDMVLTRISSKMRAGGFLFVVTPNNESVHRLLGVQLGLLESNTSLTNTEILMQQHSNYSLESLRGKLHQMNFKVATAKTSFVKPHTHKQMQSWVDEGVLTESNLEQLYQLSDFFEPFNSEIFILAEKFKNEY